MRFLRSAIRGVRALVRSRAADLDIDDEVTHYVEQLTEAHERRGLSHDDARRTALLEVGNSTVVREHVRSAGWEHTLETLIADLRYAGRWLRRSRAFTSTAIATLALAIAASTTVFSAVSPILLEPLPFPHADRLVIVDDRNPAGAPMPVTFGTFTEVRARSHSFDVVAVADAWRPSLLGTGDAERLTGERITADYFAVHSVSPIAGRGFTSDDESPEAPRVVILSDALVRRRFSGDHSIIGRTIDLDGEPHTIVGILPASFTNIVEPTAEIWAPLRDRITGDLSSREWGHHYRMVARLKPGTSLEAATRELAAIGRTPHDEFPRPAWADLKQGLLVRSMQEAVVGRVKPILFAITGAVLMLLAIAAVNVTNLLLARGTRRRPEFAMRIALGASRGRILRQLLTESTLLAIVGGLVGLALAYLGVHALVVASPPDLPRLDAVHINARVFLFSLGLTTLVGILVGFVPALDATRGEGKAGLHQSARRDARATIRSVLVVAEVGIALVLLVTAGLLLRSVTRLLSVPPGFESSNVITMQVVGAGRSSDSDASRRQFYHDALDAVRAIPGVVTAAFTSQLPLSGEIDGYGLEAQSVPSSAHGAGGSAMRYTVTLEYFAAMGIPLRTGRLFDASDRPGAPISIVINESLARQLFGNRNPIGERIRFGPQMGGTSWNNVVGVVPDVRHYSLAAPAPNAFYVASNQWIWVDNVQTLIVRANGDAAALVPSIQRAIWSVNRDRPIQRIRTMDSFVAASAGERRFALLVIEAFAIAALALAAIGLYGVVAGGVAERIREIGIRSALGASSADIVTRVVGQSLRLTLGGVLVGGVASLGATRLVQTMLFGISRIDAPTYAVVTTLLLAVAGVAGWAPARRAASIDPTITLRAD
jgi:putative ABC transport system permease protein